MTKAKLDTLKISGREFTKQLAPYLDAEWSDAFYQHIYRILKEEVEPTKDEADAMEAWQQSRQNPHNAGARLFKLQRRPRVFDKLQQAIRGGSFYNVNQILKLFRFIKDTIFQ